MKVVKADRAGFCFGVERAVSMARKALADVSGPVYSLGPIIHNPQVVQELEEAGLTIINNLNEIDFGTVIIRSHGAPANVYREADKKRISILDATCPFVKKMHSLARRLAKDGYEVVLLGEKDHPEIRSLMGDEDFTPHIVGAPSELPSFRPSKKVGLISQTTQSSELLAAVASAIISRVRELKIHNTICDSTRLRQEESLEIAREADAMVVIGGRNSANTRRLFEICRSTGTPTRHVEVPEELEPEWFAGRRTIGVTAGASTPKLIIDLVVQKIKKLNSGGK